jgi:apolipoprotein N-acyltransferase
VIADPSGEQGERPRRVARRLLWLALAVAGGVLWGLSFMRVPLGIGAWFTLAPLLPLLGTRRPATLGFLNGLAAWATSLYWIVPTLTRFGSLSVPLAILLTSLLAAFLALFHAAFAGLGAPLWRRLRAEPAKRRLLPALLGLPALWVALEWLRTYFIGGFPWNLAAYAWIGVPGTLPLSAFIGAYGISFLVVMVAVGVAATAMAFAARRPPRALALRPFIAAAALPLILLPAAARWSIPRAAVEKLRSTWGGQPVRLLQPNVADQVGFDLHQALADYRKVTGMSYQSCQPGVLVVWPESAGWPFEYHRDPLLDHDLAAMTALGCTVVFNTDTPVGPGSEQAYNSAYLLAPGEAPVRYDKRHLVPFGEYVPFEKVLFFAKTVARNVGQFRPAEHLTLMPWGRETLGPAICYEVVFPEETAALVQRGATVLLSVVNDGWYGDTAAPWQHLRAARFRAAENRRPLLRAAITGVSAVIAPDGSVWGELGVNREGVLRVKIAGERWMSPYARWPWLPPFACCVLAVGFLATVYTSRPRS